MPILSKIRPKTLLLNTFLLATLIAPDMVFADSILVIKNDKVLIDSTSLTAGDKVFATDQNGKKKAIIEIEKIKGERAYGRITKGKAEKGMEIVKSGGSAAAAPTSEKKSKSSSSKSGSNDKPFAIGALLGISFNSMTVKLADAAGNAVETLSMAGTGFSAKALVDYDFTSYLGVRLIVGLENFTVQGTSSQPVCNGTVNCRTDIMYITTDAWLRYAFIDSSSFKIWAGAGFGFWMPGSKTTNTLDESSIGSTSAIYLGLGTDIAAGDSVYIPIQAEYILLPGSAQVTANAIAARAGIGYRF